MTDHIPDAGEKLVEAVARRNAEAGGFDWDAMGVYQAYYLNAVRRDVAAIDAAGWQIVPKELTEDMWNAINSAWGAEECWANLLAAAPKVVP
jgi:hypothetical protein